MLLKELLVEKKDKDDTRTGGTYAGYRFDPEDVKKLRQWAKANKIPNRVPREKYHSTLLYSKKRCPDYKPLGKLETPIVATVSDSEIWDTQDNKRAFIVRLSSDDMVKRHKQLMKEHNATYDFDEYKPHITLSYDVGKEFDLKDVGDFSDYIPDNKIRIVEEYHEDLVDEWQNKGK